MTRQQLSNRQHDQRIVHGGRHAKTGRRGARSAGSRAARYGQLVRLTVNGSEHAVDADPGRTLLDVLREDLGLTGTKYGCGEGECGACTVLVGGMPVRACVQDAATVAGAVTTVEGLAAGRSLHPVQAAVVHERALQCGYCTPGMVLAAVALLEQSPTADDAAIRAGLAGNICRCGGYPAILRAVRRATTEGAADAGADAADAEADAARDGGGHTAQPPAAHSGSGAHVWTVVLPPSAPAAHRDWGWSTPGGVRLTVDDSGQITAYTGKVDGGQGNRAALTRLVAAELCVSTAVVQVQMGDTACAPVDLGTFGSRSIPDAGHGLRLVAVAARRALFAEAARQWQVEAADVIARSGVILDGHGREVSYGALVAGGSRHLVADPDDELAPQPAGLAEVDDAALRRQLTAAVTGAKRFPSDTAVPGMLHGRVLRPPAYGAVLRTVDTSAARDLPGVTLVEHHAFVGVVAPTRAAATAAVQALRAEWEVAEQPADTDLEWHLRAHPVDSQGWSGAVEHVDGDVDAAYAGAPVTLEETYTTAYIAHVPLEPRAALAQVDGDAATVWVGTQRPFAVRDEVAAALGLPSDRVRVVVPDFGGGFGGKHSADVAVEAARLAWSTGRPVKVSWTREEEFRWGYLRPAAVIDVRSGADRDGTLVAWEFTNINAGAAALRTPYRVAHRRERYQTAASPLAQGSYRALAATANHFARESHMDELAVLLGIDPVEFRLRLIGDRRLADVLTTLAEHLDRPAGTGSAVGIACGLEKEVRVATAAQVAVDPDGTPRVTRIVTAVDCGAVVDPTGLRGQILGASIMGLGGALFEAVHFDHGRIRTASLATYPVPRFADVPPIEVIVVDRADVASAGAGETPIVTIAPAIANAIRRATGHRLRRLPLLPGRHPGPLASDNT